MTFTLFGDYGDRVRSAFGSSLIALWPVSEGLGVVANDASGNGRTGAITGLALAATGSPVGLAPFSDALNDYINVHTASLSTAWPRDDGTMFGWSKVTAAGVWADGIQRNLFRTRSLDTSYEIQVMKDPAASSISFHRRASGTDFVVTKASFNPTGWYFWAFTWSVTNNRIVAYYRVHGDSALTTIGTTTGILAGGSNGLDTTRTVVGANTTTPGSVWGGYYCQIGVASGEASPATISAISVP